MNSLEALLKTFFEVAGGIGITLQYTFFSAMGGILLGLCLALLKVSHCSIAQALANFYTSLFRGTPLLLQLSVIYFGVPNLFAYKISPFMAGVTAFSLNSGAYVSEIIRLGIQSIDRGQYEASQALNIPYFLMMKDIILPQAFRRILPALINEGMDLLKETAIISTIGVADIMRRAQLAAAETYSYFEPLMMASLCYYLLNLGLNVIARHLEKRFMHDPH